MYDPNIRRIENDESQQMSKLLSKMEQKLCYEDFCDRLVDWANRGKKDQTFLLGSAHIPCKMGTVAYSVIVGEHIKKRVRQRSYLTPGMILSTTIQFLSCPLGVKIVQNKAVWDQEWEQMVPIDGGKWAATAIVNERDGYTIILEAGRKYVNVVTFINKTHSFYPKPGTIVYTVDKNGAITMDKDRYRPFVYRKKRAR